MALTRKLRFGMVGGGPGAFIGAVHRRAATLDGLADLVASAFSSDPDKSRAQGRELHLDSRRVYDGYEAMAEREAALPATERIDFVSVVTPNHVHFRAAKAFEHRQRAVEVDLRRRARATHLCRRFPGRPRRTARRSARLKYEG